jgi:hypothetical protein
MEATADKPSDLFNLLDLTSPWHYAGSDKISASEMHSMEMQQLSNGSSDSWQQTLIPLATPYHPTLNYSDALPLLAETMKSAALLPYGRNSALPSVGSLHRASNQGKRTFSEVDRSKELPKLPKKQFPPASTNKNFVRIREIGLAQPPRVRTTASKSNCISKGAISSRVISDEVPPPRLPSYEELLAEALRELGGSEGHPPREIFQWLARYVQPNFFHFFVVSSSSKWTIFKPV